MIITRNVNGNDEHDDVQEMKRVINYPRAYSGGRKGACLQIQKKVKHSTTSTYGYDDCYLKIYRPTTQLSPLHSLTLLLTAPSQEQWVWSISIWFGNMCFSPSHLERNILQRSCSTSLANVACHHQMGLNIYEWKAAKNCYRIKWQI